MTEPEHPTDPERDEPTESSNQIAKGDFPASPSESETETPGAGHPQGND
jgi:hypothetical protein